MTPHGGTGLSVEQHPLYAGSPRSSRWPFWLTALESTDSSVVCVSTWQQHWPVPPALAVGRLFVPQAIGIIHFRPYGETQP